MYISTIMTSSPALEKSAKEKVENPAVRAVTLEKNAPSHVMFPRSASLMSRVPPTVRTALTDRTTRACME